MQAVILAVGRGTRMKELTDEISKVMLTVNGKPILAHKIEALPPEIGEIILVVGYKKEKIQEYFGSNYQGKKINYVAQENLDGTGGALNLVKNLIKDRFLLMYGDDLYGPEDIKNVLREKLAVLACEVGDPERFGIIKVGKNGYMLDIVEKPAQFIGNLANTGLYVLDRRIYDYPMTLNEKSEYYLTEALAGLAKDYPIKVVRAEFWQPIGNPDDLQRAQEITREL